MNCIYDKPTRAPAELRPSQQRHFNVRKYHFSVFLTLSFDQNILYELNVTMKNISIISQDSEDPSLLLILLLLC